MPAAPQAPKFMDITNMLKLESMRPLEGCDEIYKHYATTFGRYPDAFMGKVMEETRERLFIWWGAHREAIRAALVTYAAEPSQPAAQEPIAYAAHDPRNTDNPERWTLVTKREAEDYETEYITKLFTHPAAQEPEIAMLRAELAATEKQVEILSDDLAASRKSSQPAAQKPVAWTRTDFLDKKVTTTTAYMWFSDPQNYLWTPLYTHPAAQPAALPAPCTWTESDPWGDMPSTYESACGEMWSFIDGGPKENSVKFCHGCGHPVAVIPFIEAAHGIGAKP